MIRAEGSPRRSRRSSGKLLKVGELDSWSSGSRGRRIEVTRSRARIPGRAGGSGGNPSRPHAGSPLPGPPRYGECPTPPSPRRLRHLRQRLLIVFADGVVGKRWGPAGSQIEAANPRLERRHRGNEQTPPPRAVRGEASGVGPLRGAGAGGEGGIVATGTGGNG